MGTKSYSRKTDRMMRDFGRRLRAARIIAGYETAADLAKDLRVEVPRYRKYERGDSMPPLEVLELLCDITNKSLDFLLLGRTDSPDRRR